MEKMVGVVGSRELPRAYASVVGDVVASLMQHGYRIGSGGAKGADQYCLEAVLDLNAGKNTTVYTAFSSLKGFPAEVRLSVREFMKNRGTVMWGDANHDQSREQVRIALLGRNERLVRGCYGLVAFLYGPSFGTRHTIGKAIRERKKVILFPIPSEKGNVLEAEKKLPVFEPVIWRKVNCSGCWEGAYRADYVK